MKTVIEMAREAGWPDSLIAPVIMAKLAEFAEVIRVDEREACAKVCDVLAVHPEYASEVAKLAAMAIRNRSNT